MKYDYLGVVNAELDKDKENKNPLCTKEFLNFAKNFLDNLNKIYFPELDGLYVPNGEYFNSTDISTNKIEFVGYNRDNEPIKIVIEENKIVVDGGDLLFIEIDTDNMSFEAKDTTITLNFQYNGDIACLYIDKFVNANIRVYTDIKDYSLTNLSETNLIPDFYGEAIKIETPWPHSEPNKRVVLIDNKVFKDNLTCNINEEWSLRSLRLFAMKYCDRCHKSRGVFDLREYNR